MKNRFPISKIIEIGEYESLVVRKGSPCSGEIVNINSLEASDIKKKIGRVSLLINEINRLRVLLGSEFSKKAPENIFLSECKKLNDYEDELEKYDNTLYVNICL